MKSITKIILMGIIFEMMYIIGLILGKKEIDLNIIIINMVFYIAGIIAAKTLK